MFKVKEGYKDNKKKYEGGYNKVIFSLVPSKTRVLDIGCSTGTLARVLTKGKKCLVTGIDIDDNSLKKASRYCDRVFKCDLDDLVKLDTVLAEESFDVITLGDVIEHLKYPGLLLNTLKKHLRKDGIIVASVPNSAFILLRIKFLFGDFSYSQKGGLMDEDHLRFFNIKTAKLLFKETGYKVEKAFGVNIVKKKFWFLKPLGKLLPSLFAIHIIITAKK